MSNKKTTGSGDWWTAPAESENGNLIMVTGRRDVDFFRNNPKFHTRMEATWNYAEADASGMPTETEAKKMDCVDNALRETFAKDPIAVLTGIYTGDGQRNWVFYTLSLNIFCRKFNEALADFEQFPITLSAADDPDWEEYAEMREATEISGED